MSDISVTVKSPPPAIVVQEPIVKAVVTVREPARITVTIAPTLVTNNVINAPNQTFVSPVMTGNPIAPTKPASSNDASVATTAFVNTATRYTHDQIIPSTVWTIVHNMHKNPAVVVIDSNGDQIIGELEYLSLDSVRLTFTEAIAGSAYLT